MGMDVLPGEDKMHQVLKRNNIILIRNNSPFGEQFNVLHHPPKTQIYSKLGTFTIAKDKKQAHLAEYPAMILGETKNVVDEYPVLSFKE